LRAARQQANCQVEVSLSVANHAASLPVAYRLYLPEAWTKDRARRKKAGVPKQIKFKTKPQLALEQIRWACESGLPRGVALMDAAYGRDARLSILQQGLDTRTKDYARTGNSDILVGADNRPLFANCALFADAELVFNRGVTLIVR
jgi:hypothetical protein